MSEHLVEYVLRISLLLVFLTVAASCRPRKEQSDQRPQVAHLLPSSSQGWTERSASHTYSGLALSDYINGGAEAYLAYGFRELAVREFQNTSGSRLTVEIYEMDRPENAYGIYSTDSAGEHWPVGADASYGNGLLRFWKGPYFVRILCWPPAASAESVVRQTGEKVANAISAESKKPDILKLLPETDILPDSVCYFHRQTSLNSIRFLSEDNLLRLADDVEALTWEQRIREKDGDTNTLRQMVIRYPLETTAAAAYEDFRKQFLKVENSAGPNPERNVPVVIQMPDQSFAGVALSSPWLMIILDAPSYESASHALLQTESRLTGLPTPGKDNGP